MDLYCEVLTNEVTMKKLLLIAALFASSAHAADANYCSLLGSVYETAAHARDNGNPPEMALQMTGPYQRIEESKRKAAINQVYFQPAFVNAGGAPLRMQVMQACMGQGQYQPLK